MGDPCGFAIKPRTFTVGWFLIMWSPMLIEMLRVFFLLLKIRKWVLEDEKRKSDIFDKDISLFDEFCNTCWIDSELVLRQRIVKSLAKSNGLQGEVIPSAMSSMRKIQWSLGVLRYLGGMCRQECKWFSLNLKRAITKEIHDVVKHIPFGNNVCVRF